VTSKAQYIDVVRATLPVTFPSTSPSTLPVDGIRTAQKDDSEHQAIRDLERDVVVVNGHLYKAGPGGWTLIVNWLVDLMVSRVGKAWEEGSGKPGGGNPTDTASSSSSSSSTCCRHDLFTVFAKKCLKAVNRVSCSPLAIHIRMFIKSWAPRF